MASERESKKVSVNPTPPPSLSHPYIRSHVCERKGETGPIRVACRRQTLVFIEPISIAEFDQMCLASMDVLLKWKYVHGRGRP